GQDLAAGEVAGDRVLRPRVRRAGRLTEDGPDLAQPRQVRILEDQADVRVSDQLTVAVDDVGVTGPADPDLRDHVPDELQVHLGHGDARVPTSRHGEGEVRLRLLAEVHGPEVGAARPALPDLQLPREVR